VELRRLHRKLISAHIAKNSLPHFEILDSLMVIIRIYTTGSYSGLSNVCSGFLNLVFSKTFATSEEEVPMALNYAIIPSSCYF
jgi:hypothetical protein